MTQGVVGGLVSISKSGFDFEVLARLAGGACLCRFYFSGFLFRGFDFSFAFYLIDFVGTVIPHL